MSVLTCRMTCRSMRIAWATAAVVSSLALASSARADNELVVFDDFNAAPLSSAPVDTNGYGAPVYWFSYAGNDSAASLASGGQGGVHRIEGIDTDGVGGSNAIFQSVDSSTVKTSSGNNTWWYVGLGKYCYIDPFIGAPVSEASKIAWICDVKGVGTNGFQDALTMQISVQRGGGLADAWRGNLSVFVDSNYATVGGTLDQFSPISFDNDNNPATPNAPGVFSGAGSFNTQFDYQTGAWGNDAGNKLSVDNFKISVIRPNWKGASGGSFTDAANWSEAAVPNTVKDFPIFRSPVVAGDQNVAVNSAIVVNRIDFDSLSNYTLAGTGSITIRGDSPGAFDHEGSDATHTFSVPVTIDKPTAGIRVNAGNGHLVFAGGLTSSGTISKDRNGFMEAKFIRAAGLNILGGQVALTGTTTTSSVGSLTFAAAAGGTDAFELGSSRLIVDYTGTSPLASLKTALANGKIKSALLDSRSAIVVAEKTDFPALTTFGDLAPDATSVLIITTLKGDSNLTQTVNFDDLLTLAQNYGTAAGATWGKGDSNGDAAVNFDDLLALAQNYGGSFALASSELNGVGGAAFAADFALAQSLVPEPTSLAALGVAATAVLGRRRR